jgi:hypothetical protein
MAPLATIMFAGCTCSSGTPAPPAPQPPAAAPPAAAAPQQGAAPQPADTSTPEAAPTPDAAAAGAAEKRATCGRYAAALAGSASEQALLDTPEVASLAGQATDVVFCGAVVLDSEAHCRRFLPDEKGPGMACRQVQAIYHELRAAKPSRMFLFSDVEWQECKKNPATGAAVCDAFREAIQSGDAAKCASAGDLEPMCRAFLALDPSLCRFSPEVESRMKKDMGKEGPSVEESCKAKIESQKFLAKDLPALATSGPPRERAFAKAALGEADACAPFIETAIQQCMGIGAATPAAPAAGAEAAPPAAQGGGAPPNG